MKRNPRIGAACGRIHPTGSGYMQSYQKFEYAIGHWLQKATEHMLGCVLCRYFLLLLLLFICSSSAPHLLILLLLILLLLLICSSCSCSF